jgi:hypothetical protein
VFYLVLLVASKILTVSVSTSSASSSGELLKVFLNLSHTHDMGTELLLIHASQSYLIIANIPASVYSK